MWVCLGTERGGGLYMLVMAPIINKKFPLRLRSAGKLDWSCFTYTPHIHVRTYLRMQFRLSNAKEMIDNQPRNAEYWNFLFYQFVSIKERFLSKFAHTINEREHRTEYRNDNEPQPTGWINRNLKSAIQITSNPFSICKFALWPRRATSHTHPRCTHTHTHPCHNNRI